MIRLAAAFHLVTDYAMQTIFYVARITHTDLYAVFGIVVGDGEQISSVSKQISPSQSTEIEAMQLANRNGIIIHVPTK